MWLIDRLAPPQYTRFIDVFGGSGTVLMSRPVKSGCMEVYNDYNSNLTNLFHCVKERPMTLLLELGFLPFNSRDEFDALQRYFECDEFNDEYLTEELALAEKYLPPLHADAIKKLLLKRAPRGNVRRAANYYKLIRYSFSGAGKSFGGEPILHCSSQALPTCNLSASRVHRQTDRVRNFHRRGCKQDNSWLCSAREWWNEK